MRKRCCFTVLLFLFAALPLAAVSLGMETAYTETTMNDIAFDASGTLREGGFTLGLRYFDASLTTAASWDGHITPRVWLWQGKGVMKGGKYGGTFITEASLGPSFRTRHFSGGFLTGAAAQMEFHNAMEKPLVDAGFAFHMWLGMRYGGWACEARWDSSTLFLYSYQWFTPVLSLSNSYSWKDWDFFSVFRLRLNDAALNERITPTLLSLSLGAERRFGK